MPAVTAQSLKRRPLPPPPLPACCAMGAYSKDGKLLNPKPSRRRVPPPRTAPPNPTKGITRSRRPSHWPSDCLSSTGDCVRYAFRTWTATPQLPTAPWTPFPHQVAEFPEQDTDLPGDRYEMPWLMFFRLPFAVSQERYRAVIRKIPPHCAGVEKHMYMLHNISHSFLRTPHTKISACTCGGTFWPTWPTGNDKATGSNTATRVNLGERFEAQ
jgi:hypothetical protein